MSDTAVELELPLGNTDAGHLATLRLQHLSQVAEMDAQSVLRLSRAFPSLGAIYGASEAELARVIGAVAAARVRWFLDAPLYTGLAASDLRRLTRAA